jgi:histidyl-tRNA synthetase
MLKRFKFFIKSSHKQSVTQLLKDARKVCNNLATGILSDLAIQNYQYDASIAVGELGLDKELVMQLVDDYVAQVIKAVVQFEDYLVTLQNSQDNHDDLDYTAFRELAHKNLGVARNLRIKDAEILLYELMKKDDLEYLVACLEALKVCAIKLSPKCAYETLKLIKLKSSL